MVRVKKLLRGTLSLREYKAKASETYALMKVLNKMTELSILKMQLIIE
ncbi:hypothetical protein [Candidatus Enterovibrio altilux]|nr:hypothetical protein [Candidatus Enterovibrio luxaltus]